MLLGLVDQLKHLPLVVVATGGHELTYFGAFDWVANTDLVPRAIIHIGASIAVDALGDADKRQLVTTRFGMTSLASSDVTVLAEQLTNININLFGDVQQFTGEGEAFCKLGVPLLSFTGMGVDFHTPEDSPERSTSPASLAAVLGTLSNVTKQFVEMV